MFGFARARADSHQLPVAEGIDGRALTHVGIANHTYDDRILVMLLMLLVLFNRRSHLCLVLPLLSYRLDQCFQLLKKLSSVRNAGSVDERFLRLLLFLFLLGLIRLL